MNSTKVYLRRFEPEDYKKINAWRKDENLYLLTTGSRYFVSSERDRQWVLDTSLNNTTDLYLAVCLVKNHLFIGYVSLSDIDHRNRRAEWSGIVIGEKEYRGQGYATEAVYLLLEYAFYELGLHRVSGSWLAENAVSLFLGKMMGFRHEGLLREYVYKNGKHHDVIIMSMLRPEFENLKQRYEDCGATSDEKACSETSVLLTRSPKWEDPDMLSELLMDLASENALADHKAAQQAEAA